MSSGKLNHTADSLQRGRLREKLTLHLGDEERLLRRASQSSHQTELVMAPVDLHQRNIQRRLRESQIPKNGFKFSAPAELGGLILDTIDLLDTTVDRIDRLSMIRAALADNEEELTSLTVPSDPQTVEQVRTEIEALTGFHPQRLDVFRKVADGLTTPIDADTTELLEAAIDIEQTLRRRTPKSISEVEVIRRAARTILRTDGDVWQDAFPEVDCVSLVGVSSVPAAHIDLLHAVLTSVAVPVHIHFRRGTGSYLAGRLPQLLDVANPGTVVFES